MAVEDSAAHIGAVLNPAVSTHDSPMGNIAVAAHDRLISKNSAPIRVAVIADNGVVIDPCIVLQFSGEVALALYKAAQIPSFDVRPNVPQSADTVEEGVFSWAMSVISYFWLLVSLTPFLLCCLSGCLIAGILLTEQCVNIGKAPLAVKFFGYFPRYSLQFQHPIPQIRVMVVEVPQFFLLGIGAEPAAAPVCEFIDRRKEPCRLAELLGVLFGEIIFLQQGDLLASAQPQQPRLLIFSDTNVLNGIRGKCFRYRSMGRSLQSRWT